MKRMVVVMGLLVLGMVLVGTLSPALAAQAGNRAGTKVDLPDADNMLKTFEYLVRNYGLYFLALVLGGGGMTQLGSRPTVGLSMVAGGIGAGLWGKVADGTSSAEGAVPGMALATQGQAWGIWLQRGQYLLSEAMVFFVPLVLFRYRAWRQRALRAA